MSLRLLSSWVTEEMFCYWTKIKLNWNSEWSLNLYFENTSGALHRRAELEFPLFLKKNLTT
jgi:hypothetical protein